MVEGIQPHDAMERLRRFEEEYKVKHEFYKINKRGEDLFGLQNQKYPELEKTDAEIKNLKKLYDLYDAVIKSLNQFKGRTWQEICKDDLLQMEESAEKYRM
jgi:dynein heavy chain